MHISYQMRDAMTRTEFIKCLASLHGNHESTEVDTASGWNGDLSINLGISGRIISAYIYQVEHRLLSEDAIGTFYHDINR